MTWKHFFPGRCIGYSIFFEHKVQKQAPASLNFLVTPATKRLTVLPLPSLLSMPSAIYFHELTFHPTLLWCDVSGSYAKQSDREKSEAHFPKTRPNLLLIGY